jgi:hypothetical protein
MKFGQCFIPELTQCNKPDKFSSLMMGVILSKGSSTLIFQEQFKPSFIVTKTSIS